MASEGDETSSASSGENIGTVTNVTIDTKAK